MNLPTFYFRIFVLNLDRKQKICLWMQIMAKKMHFNVLFCARQNHRYQHVKLKQIKKNETYLTSLCLFCILKTFIRHFNNRHGHCDFWSWVNWIGWVRGGAGRCIKKPLFLVVDRWKKLLSSRYDSMHVQLKVFLIWLGRIVPL